MSGMRWAVPIAAAALASCTANPPPEPVNLVLISIDSLRADHVHSYGYHRETSPTLDRLASEGTLFENVVAESSWTLPTHMTMLTGLPAQTHGVEYFSGSRLADSYATLAETLGEHGYRSFGVFSGPYLHPIFGFGRGFDSYESAMGATVYDDQSFDPNVPGSDAGVKEANFMSHRTITSHLVTEKAIELLGAARDEPFFLFLHYFDIHFDYLPPEELWRRFDPDYQGTMTGDAFQENNEINAQMNPRDLEHLIALYDAEILYTDQQIGYLIDALDRNGLSENTLVIVTSDHGEEFFEHGDKGHYRTLFDEVLMVPLIVRLPGRVRAGERVTEQVRHLDIAPTLLSFAGIPVPDGLLSEIGGRSLSDVLEGREALSSLPAISSLRRSGYWASVRTPGFKYIVNREDSEETELLYNLRGDPREHRPLARVDLEKMDGETQAIFADLRGALMEKESAAFAARVVKEGAEDIELPARVREELRSLGYIQ
jgi:arylsulfatase A-like enzyme